jgi:hypothetical protein
MSLLAFRLGRSRPRLDDAQFVFLLVECLLNVPAHFVDQRNQAGRQCEFAGQK